MIGQIFLRLLNMSLTAGIVILVVLLLRFFLRRMPKILCCCLWAVVLFRLLCPVSFSAPVSLLGTLGLQTRNGEAALLPEDFGTGRTAGADERLLFEKRTVSGRPKAEWEGQEAEVPSLPGQVSRAAGLLWPSGMSGIMRVITVVWLTGVLAMAGYGILSLLNLKKLLRSAREEIAEGNMGVYDSDRIETPFVLGLLHPRIYLPGHLSGQEKAYILIHERIHIRRGDPFFRLLAYLALCLHWFNPFVWAAFFLSEQDMEMSCDEAVLRKCGNVVKKDYSASVLSLTAGKGKLRGISAAFAKGDTESRIRNILGYRKTKPIFIGAAAVVCILAAVFLLGNPLGTSKEEKKGQEFYGVITTITMPNDLKQTAVMVPGQGAMTIPQAKEITAYAEFDLTLGLTEGDMIRIIFAAGEEVLIMETYPARFSAEAQAIEIMGQGFDMRQLEIDRYQMSVPLGMAQDAKAGDTLKIWYYPGITELPAPGEEPEAQLLGSFQVLSVDTENHGIRLEMTAEEAELFLKNFWLGEYCVLQNG